MMQIGDNSHIEKLSIWYYRPNEVYELTRASIEIHLSLNNKVLNQIKLQRLYKAGEATKQAKQAESKIRQHKGEADNKLVREIMKSKIRNARTELVEEKQRLRESKRNLAKEVGNGAANYIHEETKYIGEREWQKSKAKMKKHVNLIKNNSKAVKEKERAERQTYDLGEGYKVKVGDTVLKETEPREPIVYGGVQLDEDEKEILRLPSKFKVIAPLNEEEIETDVKVAGVKARWDHREEVEKEKEKERLVNTRNALGLPTIEIEDIRTQTPKTPFFNKESKSMSFRNLKANEIPSNKNINLPGPVDFEQEVKIQQFQGTLNKIGQEFIKEKCNSKGKQKTNLTKSQERGLKKIK